MPEPVIDTSGELEIEECDGVWYVEGPWLQKLVATVNFSDYESRMFFDRKLREAGIFERMEALGIQDGDPVSMYGLEFEYQSCAVPQKRGHSFFYFVTWWKIEGLTYL